MHRLLEVLWHLILAVSRPIYPSYWTKEITKTSSYHKPCKQQSNAANKQSTPGLVEQPSIGADDQMYQPASLRPANLSPCSSRDTWISPLPKSVSFDCDQKPIHEVLPLELLSLISQHNHTKTDIHNFRLVNRQFRAAAWAVFGRSFDDKIFHPTFSSVGGTLCTLAETKEVAPYVRRLNISTIVPDVEAGARLTAWVVSQRRGWGATPYTTETIRPWVEMLRSEKVWTEEERTAAWATALEGLTTLEEIVIVRGERLPYGPRWPNITGQLQSLLREASDTGLKLWHSDGAANALQVLLVVLALDDRIRNRIKTIRTDGAISMLCLPSTTTSHLPLLRSITHLSLSLDFPPTQYHALDTLAKAERHLYGFLAGMLELKNLRIDFPYHNTAAFEHSLVAAEGSEYLYGIIPRRPSRRDSIAAAAAAPPISPMDEADEEERPEETQDMPPVAQPLHFPHLQTLHLSNLILHTHTNLTHSFLLPHSPTLRTLTIQNLFGPPAESWRSFWTFLGARMQLEKFQQVTHSSAQQRERLEGDPRTRWVRFGRGEVEARVRGRVEWVGLGEELEEGGKGKGKGKGREEEKRGGDGERGKGAESG